MKDIEKEKRRRQQRRDRKRQKGDTGEIKTKNTKITDPFSKPQPNKQGVTINFSSEMMVYTGIVDRSSKFTDTSDSSVNLGDAQSSFQNMSMLDKTPTTRASNMTNHSDSFSASLRRQIPSPPGNLRGDRPSTSRDMSVGEQRNLDAELNKQKAEELIKEAERLKADIARPPGIAFMSNHTYSGCDDVFFQSIAHVDKATRDKIKRGESVDLVKLLPCNKYKTEIIRWSC